MLPRVAVPLTKQRVARGKHMPSRTELASYQESGQFVDWCLQVPDDDEDTWNRIIGVPPAAASLNGGESEKLEWEGAVGGPSRAPRSGPASFSRAVFHTAISPLALVCPARAALRAPP